MQDLKVEKLEAVIVLGRGQFVGPSLFQVGFLSCERMQPFRGGKYEWHVGKTDTLGFN